MSGGHARHPGGEGACCWMTTWKDVEREEPAFAARVRSLFDARKHKTLATLQADGSPRISGIEAEIKEAS